MVGGDGGGWKCIIGYLVALKKREVCFPYGVCLIMSMCVCACALWQLWPFETLLGIFSCQLYCNRVENMNFYLIKEVRL